MNTHIQLTIDDIRRQKIIKLLKLQGIITRYVVTECLEKLDGNLDLLRYSQYNSCNEARAHMRQCVEDFISRNNIILGDYRKNDLSTSINDGYFHHKCSSGEIIMWMCSVTEL